MAANLSWLQNQPQRKQGFFGNIASDVENKVKGAAKTVEHDTGKVAGFFGNIAKGTAETAIKVPIQFAEDYANTFGNLGRKAAGAKGVSIQQGQGTDPLDKLAIRFSGATGTNEQLAGDAAQIGSTFIAPVRGASLITNLGRSVAAGAVGGAGNAAGNDESAAQIGKGAIEGGALGAAFEGIPKILTPAGRAEIAKLPNDVQEAIANLQLHPLDSAGSVSQDSPLLPLNRALGGGTPTAPELPTAPPDVAPQLTPPGASPEPSPALPVNAPPEAPLSELGGNRPANDLQGQLEQAWNGGDLRGAQQVIDQLPPDLQAPMQKMQDARVQGAAATAPSQHAQLSSALTGEPLPTDEVPARELSPEEQQDMQYVHQDASAYNNPDAFIHDLAKQALDREKSNGVDLVPDGERYGGGYKRVSSHAQWYSKLYGELGHKPSVAATEDAVRNALQGGRSADLVDSHDKDVFNHLQDREQGLQQTVQQGPPPDIAAQYMDSLAGKPEGVETAPVSPQAKLKLGNAKGRLPKNTSVSGTIQDVTHDFPENQRGFLGSMQKSNAFPEEARQRIASITPQTYDPWTNTQAMEAGRRIIGEDPDAAHQKLLSAGTLDTDQEAAALQLIHQYSASRDFDKMTSLADKLDESGREHGRGVQILSALNRMTPDGAVYYTNKLVNRAAEKIGAKRGFGKGVAAAKDIAKQYRKHVNDAGAVDENDVLAAVHEAINRPGGIPAGLSKEPGVGQLDIEGFSKDLPGKGVNSDTSIPSGLPAKPGEGQLDINGKPFEKPNENPTTGEKIARNVEKMAEPAKKAKADELVKEITKKVKQEMMEPNKATPKSPIDVMREVFKRNSEAQEAFPEAQKILMDKAAGNPKLQATLQKFFDSELGKPVADSTVNAAIKEQLRTNETKVGDIITKSLSGQRQSIEQVAQDLTRNGFDPQAAKSIAEDVVTKLEQQTSEAKQRALVSLDREVPKRYKKTFVEKVNKLSNLGALSDGDYLDLARAKLKLPHMTQDMAQQVHDMAQQIQDAPEGYERDQMERQLMHTVNESIPKTKGEKLADLLSAPKALQATGDISGVLHQGGVLGARFPKEWAQAFGHQVSYLKSSESYGRAMSAIKHDPAYDLARKAKVDLTGVQGGEEAFASQLPERIKGVGGIVRGSDRAYTGALTELRFGAFTHILQDMHDSGIDVSQLGDDQLQSLGKFINTASGRGHGNPGGLFEKVAPALNRTLFSPRLWKSRLDMLNPAYYAKLDPVARKYALQSASSFAGIAATVLGLASVMGGQVETDPRSSDFLKVRFGDTRYDILGGFQQNLVFAARELAGSTKSSTSGAVSSLTGGGALSQNRLSILTDLIQNKENPIIGAGENLLRGTDNQGNKVNPATTIGSLAIPLSLQDMYGVATSSNPVAGLLAGEVPSAIGLGVTSYPAPGDPGETANSNSGTSQFLQYQRSLAGSR